MPRSATIPRSDAALKRVAVASLPPPMEITTLPSGFCAHVYKTAEPTLSGRTLISNMTTDAHYIGQDSGTQLGADYQRCGGMQAMAFRANAHLSPDTVRIAISPEEIESEGPCHVINGVAKEGETLVRGDYPLNIWGCERLYKAMATLPGWGCTRIDRETNKLSSYPLPLLPQMLARLKGMFKKGQFECKQLIDKAVRMLLHPRGERTRRTLQYQGFGLSSPNGDGNITNSINEDQHSMLIRLNKFLIRSKQRFERGLRDVLHIGWDRPAGEGLVFKVQDGTKLPERFSYPEILDSEIATPPRSDFYKWVTAFKAKIQEKAREEWDGFIGRAPEKGITIPASKVTFVNYCQELWNEIKNHTDWKCGQSGVGTRLVKCPKGLETLIPRASWNVVKANCEEVKRVALRDLQLTPVNETRWTAPALFSPKAGDYDRIPLMKVGREPKIGFDTAELEQETFYACYSRSNLRDPFYDVLSAAAAEKQRRSHSSSLDSST